MEKDKKELKESFEKGSEKEAEKKETEKGKKKELSQSERMKVQELLSKASQAFEKSNFGFAAELYDLVLRIDPDNEDASKMFFPSAVAFRETKGKNPLADIEGFFKNIPYYVKWLLKKAKGFEEEQIVLLREIIKNEPKNHLILKQIGYLAVSLGAKNQAAGAFEAYIKLKPDDMSVLKTLGQIYMDLDKRDLAKMAFKKVLKKNPFDADASKGLKDISAKTTIEKSKWDDNQDFRSKIRDEEEAKLAEIESHLAKTEEDIKLLIKKNEEELERNPASLKALKNLTDLYKKLNMPEKSLEYYKQLSKYQPGDADLALSVVKTEYELKESQGASESELLDFLISGYENLCRQFPTNYKLHYEFGNVLLNAGKYDEAIAEFQKSMVSPNFKVESMNKLGLCFEMKKFYDLAIDEFKKGLSEIGEEMTDLKKEILYNLANTLEKAGRGDEALSYYKKIYQVDITYKDVAKKIEHFHKSDSGSTSTET